MITQDLTSPSLGRHVSSNQPAIANGYLNLLGLQSCRECDLCGDDYDGQYSERRKMASPYPNEKPHMKVAGRGIIPCDVYILGEGPGRDEDQQGLPFVGQAGETLQRAIERAGLHTNKPQRGLGSVYIGNTVRCRPPHNRKPYPWEMEACSHWTEIEMVKAHPKVIVALGATALSYFTPAREWPKGAKVGDSVGKEAARWHPNGDITGPATNWVDLVNMRTKDGSVPVIGCYHPAARDPKQRAKVTDVLLKVALLIGVTLSQGVEDERGKKQPTSVDYGVL